MCHQHIITDSESITHSFTSKFYLQEESERRSTIWLHSHTSRPNEWRDQGSRIFRCLTISLWFRPNVVGAGSVGTCTINIAHVGSHLRPNGLKKRRPKVVNVGVAGVDGHRFIFAPKVDLYVHHECGDLSEPSSFTDVDPITAPKTGSEPFLNANQLGRSLEPTI